MRKLSYNKTNISLEHFFHEQESEKILLYSSLLVSKKRKMLWNSNSQSYEVEQIQAMAVVHNFPSTSWLEATDGTSNSSFSQSPAPAPSALASAWHHNEEDRHGKKKKKKKLLVVLDKCNSLSMAQHARKTTRWYTTHKHMLLLHIHMDGWVVSFDSGGSQGRNSWREQWETTELFRKWVWKQQRHKLSAMLPPYKSK